MNSTLEFANSINWSVILNETSNTWINFFNSFSWDKYVRFAHRSPEHFVIFMGIPQAIAVMSFYLICTGIMDYSPNSTGSYSGSDPNSDSESESETNVSESEADTDVSSDSDNFFINSRVSGTSIGTPFGRIE